MVDLWNFLHLPSANYYLFHFSFQKERREKYLARQQVEAVDSV